MVSPRALTALAAAALALAAIALFLTATGREDDVVTQAWQRSAPAPDPIVDRPRGGAVRIAVGTPPELADVGVGGVTLRSLVLPRLFVAQPDGSWRPSLVEPGTDRGSSDSLSASFELRRNAVWSNGRPITVEDLRRTMDTRFVASVDGPGRDGRVTVRFNTSLADWRRLWSGDEGIAAPAPDVFGGPYRIMSVISGLETVLARNERWFGGGAFLDEVRLVLTADSIITLQLFERNELDVVAPPADAMRTAKLRAVPGAQVDRGDRGGAVVALRMNPRRIAQPARERIAAVFPRAPFIESLLREEAVVMNGFAPVSPPTWEAQLVRGDAPLAGTTVTLTATAEQPLAPVLQRAFVRSIVADGGRASARVGENTVVTGWEASNDYEVLLDVEQVTPSLCWVCAFPDVSPELGKAADGGDVQSAAQLEQRLRSEGLYLPLWRAFPVVAWKSSVVGGVRANGFTGSAAWNAHLWWRP